MTFRKNKKICCADRNKSECSLIEELRELQDKENKLVSELENRSHCLTCRFLYDNVGFYDGVGFFGIKISETEYRAAFICGNKNTKKELIEELKHAISEEEKLMTLYDELDEVRSKIKEIKEQLGIK